MTVGELKKRLHNVPEEVNVVFCATEQDEDQDEGDEDISSNGKDTCTTCNGDLLSAYSRANHTTAGPFVEFVLDCSIQASETIHRV